MLRLFQLVQAALEVLDMAFLAFPERSLAAQQVSYKAAE